MNFLIGLGYYTIFFTPAIFVISIIGAIKAIKEGEDTMKYTVWACISLMLIVILIYMMLFNT